jgi:hypothetical protein
MLLKEHSRDPRLCALLQAMVGVQNLRVSSSGGPHVDAVHGRAGPDRTGCPGACSPSSVYHTRPGGWRESRDVALGAVSCMRRVRELTARGKPGARSSG